MQNLHLIQETWDIRRIVIGILVATTSLVGVGYGVKSFLLDKKENQAVRGKEATSGRVEGLRVEEDTAPKEDPSKKSQLPLVPSASLQTTIEQRLEDIRKDAAKIDVLEVASSSPQVQKIIKDLRALEQYPRSQAKDICENICKGL